MNSFKQAWNAMLCGCKVKRKDWNGYWTLENDMIYMHCDDNTIIKFTDTKDLPFTINNILADDWIIIDNNIMVDSINNNFDICEAIRRMKNGAKIANKDINVEYFYIDLNNKLRIKSYSNTNLIKDLLNFDILLNSNNFYEVLN